MKELLLVAPDNFDLTVPNNTVLAGPWVLLGKSGEFVDELSNYKICTPFGDFEELNKVLDSIEILSEKALYTLVQYLSTKLETEMQDLEWRVLLSDYYLDFTAYLYEKYLRVMDAIRMGEFRVQLNFKEFEFSEPSEILKAFHFNKIFNESILSAIIQNLNPPGWHISYKTGSLKVLVNQQMPIEINPVNKKFRLIFGSLYSRALGLSNTHFDLIGRYGLSLSQAFKLLKTFECQHSKRSFHRREDYSMKPSPLQHIPLDPDRPFEALLSELLIKFLPNYFQSKNFRKLRTWADKQCNYIGKGKIFLTTNNWYQLEKKFILASHANKGGRIGYLQHGSYYGSLNRYPSLNAEFQQCHFYFSWGWKHWSNGCKEVKAVPLKSPFILDSMAVSESNPSKVTMISDSFRVYSNRLATISWLPEQQQRKVQRQAQLLSNLKQELWQHIQYRPYLGEPDSLQYLDDFKSKFTWLKMADKEMRGHVRESRLLIMDYPGTTYHFLMAHKIPCLLLLELSEIKFNPEAQAVFDQLYECNLIHDSPLSLANFINQKYESTSKWWFDKKTQEAVEAFNQHYAFTGPDWADDWMSVLKEIDKLH